MKFGEECGIYGGITFNSEIAPYIQSGLFILQHRGQESAGICCGDDDLTVVKGKGLVMEVLKNKHIKNLKGNSGIGHVRYSTQGGTDSLNAQPIMVNYMDEKVSIAHNGNVKAAMELKKMFECCGEIFLTSSDTEVILKKVIRETCKKPSSWTFKEVGEILTHNFTGGAWSLLFGFAGRVMAFRDPFGYRPLFFCEAEEGYFVGSEDSAFQLLNIKNIIEIEPGEGVEITSEGYKIERFAEVRQSKNCVFEHIYFARPNSNVFGRNVYSSRVELGKKFAQEDKTNADIVVPVMDSGFPAALGYSQQSGIPLQVGLLRNHWVGRSFIKPDQDSRRAAVLRKLMPIKQVIQDKSIILVDDSLVRGTTSREIIRMLKKAGAKEVHLRIASPKIVNTCFWGVDIPTKEELIANSFECIKDMASHLEANSLEYISFEGMKEVFGDKGWCYHCFEK